MDSSRAKHGRYPGYVLVIDADEETLDGSLTTLADRGHDAVPATTIEQIREIAKARGRPVAIVIEPASVRLDGFRLCRGLRSAYERNPPLIALASHRIHGRVAESRALDAGADLFVERPAGDGELLAAIDAAAADATGAAGGAATGESELDRLRVDAPTGVRPPSGGWPAAGDEAPGPGLRGAAEPGPVAPGTGTSAAAVATAAAAPATTLAMEVDSGAHETIDLTEASPEEFESWLDQAFSGFDSPQQQPAEADEPAAASVAERAENGGLDAGETVSHSGEIAARPEASTVRDSSPEDADASAAALTSDAPAPETLTGGDVAARGTDAGVTVAAAATLTDEREPAVPETGGGEIGSIAALNETPAPSGLKTKPAPRHAAAETSVEPARDEHEPATRGVDAVLPPVTRATPPDREGHSRGRRRIWPLLGAALVGGGVVGIALWLIGVPGSAVTRATDPAATVVTGGSVAGRAASESLRPAALEEPRDDGPSVPGEKQASSASDQDTEGVPSPERPLPGDGVAAVANDRSNRAAEAAEPRRPARSASRDPAPRPGPPATAPPRGSPAAVSKSTSAGEKTPASSAGALQGAEPAEADAGVKPQELAAADVPVAGPTETAPPPAVEPAGGALPEDGAAVEEPAVVAETAGTPASGGATPTGLEQKLAESLRPAEDLAAVSGSPARGVEMPGQDDRAGAQTAQAVQTALPAAPDKSQQAADAAPAEPPASGNDAPAEGAASSSRTATVITAPELIRTTRVEPRYPLAARRLRASGTVKLRVMVAADGHVTDVKIIEEPSSSLGFGRAAADAVSLWRFRPALRDGKPVSQSTIVRVVFEP